MSPEEESKPPTPAAQPLQMVTYVMREETPEEYERRKKEEAEKA